MKKCLTLFCFNRNFSSLEEMAALVDSDAQQAKTKTKPTCKNEAEERIAILTFYLLKERRVLLDENSDECLFL